jgi:intracellular septation protein A
MIDTIADLDCCIHVSVWESRRRYSMSKKSDSIPASPSVEPETAFQQFAKNAVGMLTALSGMPMLLSYWNMVEAPTNDRMSEVEHSSIAALLCAVIFLAMFWSRHKFARGWWLVIGVLALICGIAFIYARNSFTEEFGLWAPTIFYLVGFVVAVSGVGIVLLHGFVRSHERSRSLSSLAVALDADQWSQLSAVADGLISARSGSLDSIHSSNKLIKKQLEAAIDDVVRSIEGISRGEVRARSSILERLILDIGSDSQCSSIIVSDCQVNSWQRTFVKGVIEGLGGGREDSVVLVVPISASGDRPDEEKLFLKELEQAGARIIELTANSLDMACGHVSFILLGDIAVAEWNPSNSAPPGPRATSPTPSRVVPVSSATKRSLCVGSIR